MKKVIIILILTIVSNFSFSQENFGVFAGVNYSYFTEGFAGKVYTENSFGLQLGALYNLGLTHKISFRPKLSFSQQGDRTKTEQTSNFELNQIDYKLTYLNTSLDFKFWDKIYLLAGPQIGILIDQKNESADLGKVKSNVDFGFNLGTGLKVNKLFLNLVFTKGFQRFLNMTIILAVKQKLKTDMQNLQLVIIYKKTVYNTV
ncbi:MAG TPA: outer membrane beta-barrel protein [Flavobacteriaceae bacterium]|nr:outer membrane beta-barrel protein [Flavobacteriaceae bacterium]